MKPRRQESQNPPRNGNAGAAQPRSEADDVSSMWNAVAALLDNQTVNSKAQPASPAVEASSRETVEPVAPQPVAAQPATPQPAAAADEIMWEMPAEAAAAPAAQSSFASYAAAQAPQSLPETRAGLPPFDTAPYAPPPAYPAQTEPVPGPTMTRDGQHTIPAEPGAGPQLLPMPDPFMPATPQYPAAEPLPAGAWSDAAPFVPRVPGSPFTMPVGLDFNSVNIRGRNDGISIEIGHGVWADLLNLLSYRLEQSAGFFRNGYIAVEVGNRSLTEPELGAMRQVMASYGMEPSVLRTSAERTFHAAVAIGLSVTQTALDGSVITEAHRAVAEQSAQGYFVYRGSLRSGQILYRPEHVVVIGDVNPGAEVVSDGDILIWGRLRGIAHAGARGNTESIITALDLDPVQLRIDTVIAAAQAGVSSSGPRWGTARSQARRPEIARLTNGRLLIEAWDEIKTAGMPFFKRRRAD